MRFFKGLQGLPAHTIHGGMDFVTSDRAPITAHDGWLHIVPKGELPNAEAGIVQVLDDTAMDSILAGIEKDKNRLGDRWPGIYAGREHFIYDDTKDSAALAWFKDFKKDAAGIWAKDDGLTPDGTKAVTNREYKYTSFVSDPKQLQKIDGKRYRVTGIETIGFTNQANGKELLTPIANRLTSKLPPAPADKCCPDCKCQLVGGKTSALMTCPECDQDFADASAPAANQNHKTKNTMKSIATKLGLAAEASEDAILAEVTKILNRVTELAPHEEENKKLKNRLDTANTAAVDSLLAAHGVKDQKVLNRLKPVLAGIEDHDERLAALADFGFKPVEAPAKPATKVLNRGNGAAAAAETSTAGVDDKVLTDKIKNRANELKGAAPARKFDDCWKQATTELTPKA